MRKLCVVQVNVTNMDEGIKFYCDTLGLKVKSRDYYPHIVELENNGLPLILSQTEKKAKIEYPKQAQTVLNFESKNLLEDIRKLKSEGVDLIHTEPQDCPVGVYAALRDPSGNVHELIEFQKQ